MKKVTSFIMMASIAGLTVLSACKKEECHECHYEGDDGKEVEIGEYCDEDLEKMEKDGYTKDGKTYEVHCEDH